MARESRGLTISQGRQIGAEISGPAVSLLFAAGRRPDPEAIRRLAQQEGGFSVSLDPSEEPGASGIPADGRVWLELLVNGLTFDLLGLTPGQSCETPPHAHRYALAAGFDASGLEAVTLRLSPHIAGGRAMPPVVRSLAQLGATLSALAAAEAIAWHPARTLCGPDYFREGVQRWIGGGVFPALGLTALAVAPDGGMQSEGLALFIGQELRLEPELMRDRAEGAKIGVRLIDYLVELGRIDHVRQIDGPDGQPLRLEPSTNGRFVRVWRG